MNELALFAGGGGDFSLQNYLDGIPLEPSKSTPTVDPSYFNASKTEYLKSFQYGMMCKPLTEIRGKVGLGLFQGASHVKMFRWLGKGWVSAPESVQDYGKNLHALLKKCNLRLLSSKIPHSWLLKDWTSSSMTLPVWGMMHDGVLWELGTLEPPIAETECGFWPTPVAYDTRAPGPNSHRKLYSLGGIAKYQWGTDYGSLNPDWVEWLMGWPIGWTELKPLAMDKFRSWLRLLS